MRRRCTVHEINREVPFERQFARVQKVQEETVKEFDAKFAVSSIACLLILGVAACGGGSSSSTPSAMTIKTLSNRADMISDGDAFVEVVLPQGATPDDLAVDVDGRDVTTAFAPRSNGRILGVVSGLKNGTSTLTAKLKSNGKGAKLQITNTDRGGPIFSGPHVEPWICATKAGASVTVVAPGTILSASVTTRTSGLDSDPTDANCNAPPSFTYYYQPKALQGTTCTLGITGANPCFVQFDPVARPADAAIADFTNDRGDTVKSMLRRESGTADRGMYQVLTYFDPAQPWQPWAPQKGWNGKLMWKMGAATSGNRFQQSASASNGGLFDANALALGFMVATAQYTNHLDNNNEHLAAEQMMMVKEHIIDTYGEVRYTMSDGLSGGSMMQTNIVTIMPGLLQGIQPAWSYPDAVSTWLETRDCGILASFYQTAAGTALDAIQRQAIEGKPPAYCTTWVGSFILPQKPTLPNNCGFGFPAGIVYDPALRPTGVRCSIHDMMVNIFGTAMDTDRNVKPKLPYDNVGVQYGLQALRSGALTAEQFVQLNETIGAYDSDMNWTGGNPAAPTVPAPRFRSLPDVFPQIYSSGLLASGKNLGGVPMIDIRPEFGPNIHMDWRSSQMRARLDAANGGHANQVIRGATAFGAALIAQSFTMMDKWLTAIEADKSSAPIEQKVVNNKPANVKDGCFATPAAVASDLANELSLTDATCPIAPGLNFLSPRQVAGGPRSEDVFKCQLKALDTTSADYGGVAFAAGQVTRLRAVFPDGVCDWTKPGVSQTSQTAVTSFMGGPNGTVVPPAPSSTPF
jgi:uncharacterized tannase-like protein DUF6351